MTYLKAYGIVGIVMALSIGAAHIAVTLTNHIP